MIGIYDSGVGGLGIFNAIKQVLPYESIIYYGDTAYFPFGSRQPNEVRRITLQAIQKLAQQCTIIVLACNTASVNDLDYFREQVAIPIVGVVPVIKTAAALTKNNKIALLGTTITTASAYTDKLIRDFAVGKTVYKIACPGLATAVEYHNLTEDHLRQYLAPVKDADIVVLGCTHYTLIKGEIQRLVGPDVKVIDSNEAVARQTLRMLQQSGTINTQMQPTYTFECSGDKAAFLDQIKRYAHL